MIVDNSQEIEKMFEEGIERILYVENEIKNHRNEIKDIKKELKENGVDMKLFNKTLTQLKRIARENKKSDPIDKEAKNEAERLYTQKDTIRDYLNNIFGD